MVKHLSLLLLLLGVANGGKLVGEMKPAPKNDEVHQELANKAVEKINAESNDFYTWTLVSIDDVHQHILSGVLYKLRLTLAQTDCTKKAGETTNKICSAGNKLKKCTVNIQRKAWEDYEKIEIVGCEEPFMSARRQVKRRSTRSAFLMEEYGKTVKPKDYVAWKRFDDFADRYDKQYVTKKHIHHRFNVFKHNLKHIRHHQDREMGTAVYGVTQFADLTPHEWKKTYIPYVWEEPIYMNTVADLKKEGISLNEDLPDSFDWREKGAVTGVKNQGACGSCWAFSTTGNVEGQWFLAKKKLVSLAEQQLVDCDSLDQGCNGGLPSNAYKEIIRMGGLEPEDMYPYDAKDETCHITRKDIAVYINGSVELPHDESAMKAWLVHKGPISIGINANPLQFYRHGISHPFKIFCEPFMLNHGVLIVGYGEEKKKPFWIVKNSWGEKWGESGYYRLYRGKNVCGVREMATTSVVN